MSIRPNPAGQNKKIKWGHLQNFKTYVNNASKEEEQLTPEEKRQQLFAAMKPYNSEDYIGKAIFAVGGGGVYDTTPSVSPTPTPTPSITPTSTNTPTPSITPTNTTTPSITPTNTTTPTPTKTLTPTPTPSSSPLPPASVSFITEVGSNTNANSYSFSGTNIGGPGLIVLSVGTYVDGATPTKSISGITINGVSATFTTAGHSGNFYFGTQTLAYVRITAGTTADIVVSFGTGNGTPANCNVGVFRIQNNLSDTPYQQIGPGENGSNTQTFTLTSLPQNSVGVMGITQFYTRNGPSVSNATAQYTTTRELGKYTAANFTSVGGGNLTITNTYTNAPGGNDVKTIIISWA